VRSLWQELCKESHTRLDILSMANVNPNTKNSHFFVYNAHTSWMDGEDVIFRKVVRAYISCTIINVLYVCLLTNQNQCILFIINSNVDTIWEFNSYSIQCSTFFSVCAWRMRNKFFVIYIESILVHKFLVGNVSCKCPVLP